MLLTLENIYKSFGAHSVLEDVSIRIEESDKLGLIGMNGAGKSTLLNILYGELEADEGVFSRKTDLKMGFLRQNSGLEKHNTIDYEMRSVFTDLLTMQQNMRCMEAELSNCDDHQSSEYKDLAARYSHLQAMFESGEGYLIDVKINTILNGMGFLNKDRETIIDTLSGGEKTRLALCKLLLESPELLILDEPTNHLDFKTLIWLEDYLQSYRGAIVVVSHDRYFLDRITTQTYEIEHHKLLQYSGNYSKYVELKAERFERLQKEYTAQQAEIAKLQDYADRNMARASTSKMAKSKLKAIDRMEPIERPKPPAKPPKIYFHYSREPVKDILIVENLEVAVGTERKVISKNLDIEIKRGDKIALIGDNGVGKSTFLKIIQHLAPFQKGRLEWGKNVDISYFEQEDLTFSGNKDALNELWDRFPRIYEHNIRTILGQLQLTGENVFKPVSALSGGEKARLKFAVMMLKQGNVLILDEPTNHLDLAAKDALDKALCEFEGTIIAVSHDRYLLSKMPTKIAEMTGDGFIITLGNFQNYLEQKGIAAPQKSLPIEEEKTETDNSFYRSKKQRSEQLARKKKLEDLETNIAYIEYTISQLEAEISTPEVASDYAALTERCNSLEIFKSDLSLLYEEWAEIGGEI